MVPSYIYTPQSKLDAPYICWCTLCVLLCCAGFERQAVPLAVYGVQLLLNFLWTPLFFKVHRLDLASADIAGEATT
jgi:tryptophan-rich sensory protein